METKVKRSTRIKEAFHALREQIQSKRDPEFIRYCGCCRYPRHDDYGRMAADHVSVSGSPTQEPQK